MRHMTLRGQTRDPNTLRAQYLENYELETSDLVCSFVSGMPSGRTNNFPESGRGLGHVPPTIFGSTVGYPSHSLASCRDTDAFSFKIACFSEHNRCLTPPSGEMPWRYQHNLYTAEKYNSATILLQTYGSIFIRLAVVAFQNREITRNSGKV